MASVVDKPRLSQQMLGLDCWGVPHSLPALQPWDRGWQWVTPAWTSNSRAVRGKTMRQGNLGFGTIHPPLATV